MSFPTGSGLEHQKWVKKMDLCIARYNKTNGISTEISADIKQIVEHRAFTTCFQKFGRETELMMASRWTHALDPSEPLTDQKSKQLVREDTRINKKWVRSFQKETKGNRKFRGRKAIYTSLKGNELAKKEWMDNKQIATTSHSFQYRILCEQNPTVVILWKGIHLPKPPKILEKLPHLH